MNKVLKLALGAVLGVALVTPAFAQDNFPDVPENHWAYGALSNLKDKVLFGYPDGFYRGSRMMSRYEFAVGINQVWTRMNSMFQGVDEKLAALERMIRDNPGGQVDVSALERQIAELRQQVQGMQGWQKSIEDLQKLSSEFERELAALGVDVDAMKRDISDLKSRVEALENRTTPIKIGATVNALILAGHSDDNLHGILPDGTIVGREDFNGLDNRAGFTRDFKVVHDINFNFSGETDGGIKWNADLAVGNALGTIGAYNNPGAGAGFGDAANTDIYFNTAYVSYDSSLVGQGVGVTIGRFGHQVGKYLWQRPAYSADYYQNEFRNNGDWYLDGLALDFNFGAAVLKAFAGRNSNLLTTNGAELNGSFLPGAGNAQYDATLGLQLNVPIGDNGDVTLAYLWQDSFDTNVLNGQAVNRRSVYGADLNFGFGAIAFSGSFAKSDISYNTSNVIDRDNTAWEAGLKYSGGSFDLAGGYRRVEENFQADGSWGRLGLLWNPTNIEGFHAGLKFRPSSDLSIYAKGEFVEAINGGGAGGWAVANNDEIYTYKVGVDYKLSNAFDLGLKYEHAKFDYNTGSDPELNWYTLRLGYNMAENAKLVFTYIYSDVDLKGRGPGFGLANQYKGGFLGTQLSVKF